MGVGGNITNGSTRPPPAFTTTLTHTHLHTRIGLYAGPVIGHQRQPSPPIATNIACYVTINSASSLGGTVASRA